MVNCTSVKLYENIVLPKECSALSYAACIENAIV